MIGGLARSPNAITNIPINGYMLFPNADDGGAWYYKDWNGVSNPIGSLNPKIGADRVFAKRTTTQNSTATNYVTYLSMTVPNTTAAALKHELIVNYIWNYANTGRDFQARILIDGVAIPELLIKLETKDSGQDQRVPGTYFDEIDIQPGGSTIDFQFSSSSNGTRASVHSCRMRSMRV